MDAHFVEDCKLVDKRLFFVDWMQKFVDSKAEFLGSRPKLLDSSLNGPEMN
jgi:hypothetical protein